MHDFNLVQKLGPAKQVIEAFRGVLGTTQAGWPRGKPNQLDAAMICRGWEATVQHLPAEGRFRAISGPSTEDTRMAAWSPTAAVEMEWLVRRAV